MMPGRLTPVPASTPSPDPVAELAQLVLHSLPRADQRESGELYVKGLLAARGRKSMRNIAAPTGRPADAQRLHHFISDSTWQWTPVRRALAEQLDHTVRPRAWVVRSTVTPRSVPNSVGADHFIDPQTGRAVHGQKSVALWRVTANGSFPVNWRIVLPPRWHNTPQLRAQSGIPEDIVARGATANGLDMIQEAVGQAVRRAPVVMDARRADVTALTGALAAAGLPYLLRISGSLQVVPGPAPLKARTRGTFVSVRNLAAQLTRPGPGTGTARLLHSIERRGGRQEVTRLQCHTAAPAPSPQQVLLVEPDPHRPQHATYWLSNLTGTDTATLHHLATTPADVARTAAGPGRAVGLHDFDGRSYAGWHRHTTLASTALTAALLLPGSDDTQQATAVAC